MLIAPTTRSAPHHSASRRSLATPFWNETATATPDGSGSSSSAAAVSWSLVGKTMGSAGPGRAALGGGPPRGQRARRAPVGPPDPEAAGRLDRLGVRPARQQLDVGAAT